MVVEELARFSCLSNNIVEIVLNTSELFLQNKKVILPDDDATPIPFSIFDDIDEILSNGKSTLFPKIAFPYTLLSVTIISLLYVRKKLIIDIKMKTSKMFLCILKSGQSTPNLEHENKQILLV